MKSKAQTITRVDWNEIAMLPAVQEAFETKNTWGAVLSEIVYGAKFVLSSYEESDNEIIIYTLVRTFPKKKWWLFLNAVMRYIR